MKKNVNESLKTLTTMIGTYNYYTDLEKVYFDANSLWIELNILNSLIGSRRIEEDFKELATRYPEILKVVPILLAKRESEILVTEPSADLVFKLSKTYNRIEEYAKFMREAGLFDLLQNRLIHNLVDYAIGVGVGRWLVMVEKVKLHKVEELVEK